MVTVILLGLGGGPVQMVAPLEVSQSSDSLGTAAEPQPRGHRKKTKWESSGLFEARSYRRKEGCNSCSKRNLQK